jgi:transcriptional regulator with XRE-family HTH domain
MLNVKRSTVSQIESGKRALAARELSSLADALGITIDSFIDPSKEFDVVLEPQSTGYGKKQMRINVPQKDVRKFKEVLLYILEQVGSRPNVGETVIYKLLYFIDFDFYEKYEEQLIGATYIKNKFGPTPVEFDKIVKQMIHDEEIVKVASKYYSRHQTKYLPRREADLEVLKASEIKTIDDVLCRLANMNGTTISNYSHKDIPWLTTEDNGIIEYESVFYRNPPYSQRNYDEPVQ